MVYSNIKKFAEQKYKFLKHLSLFKWLIILTVLYLFWQISLSGAILIADSEDASHRLSELAKNTVGFGTALFVFRATFRKIKLIIAFILAMVLGWAAIQAEDGIVNYFAKRTTGQERLEARTILLFNTALLKESVTLPDLSEQIAGNPVKLAAFSKILGFAIWNNPTLMSQIMRMGKDLLISLHGQEAYNKADKEYERYVEVFKQSALDREKTEKFIKQANFAAWLSDLNKILVMYAGCTDDSCKNHLQSQVDSYVSRSFGDLGLKLTLDDFCRKESGSSRYYMGKKIESIENLVCSTSEQEFQTYVIKQIDEIKLKNAPDEIKALPHEISSRILSSELIKLDEWRKIWAQYIDSEFASKSEAEFANTDRYAANGADAEAGRNFAISVFLPPVALGFSITVCFLHLASLLSAATHKPLACGIFAATIYLLPVFFGVTTPLSGIAGIYAKWLVSWEGILYPFGIFRWLII